MKAMIQKVPVPLSGVMLGWAALGNLLQSYSEGLRLFCGAVSAVLLLLLLAKLILFPGMVKEELKNPAVMGVSATFPMGLMLLSVYGKPFIGPAAMIIWFGAIGLHLVLICAFTYRFLRKPDITKVFASYFVVYVGIAAAGVSAPAFEQKTVGMAAFWFALVSLLALLVLVGYRYWKHPNLPEPVQPIFCIFAAPASLCLVAYLGKLLTLLRRPFFPSHAAFTFPFVISAIAMKGLGGYLGKIGMSIPFLPTVVLVETVIAAILTCLVLVRFALFLLRPAAQKAAATQS